MLPLTTTILDFFVHLMQGVYLPWCTSIQSLPSLCHVLFASQKKVRSHTSMYTSKASCRFTQTVLLKQPMSLMFQTWWGNSRKCRMHQTPAQWPSSSNKEQVGHKIAFAPSVFQRGTLTCDALVCSSHFSPAEAAWASYFSWVFVREYVCLLIHTCPSLS